jgi:hypothetical protein
LRKFVDKEQFKQKVNSGENSQGKKSLWKKNLETRDVVTLSTEDWK